MRWLLVSMMLLFSMQATAISCEDIWTSAIRSNAGQPATINFPTVANPITTSSLQAVDYYYPESNNWAITNNSVYTTSGPTTRLFLRGNLQIGNGAQLNIGSPTENLILVVAGSISIGNNVQINGFILAGGAISIGNNSNINGAVTAKGAIANSGTVTYQPDALSELQGGVLCDTPLVLPVAEYRFDQYNWDGSPDEVADSIGSNSGQAISTETIAQSQICRASDFSGSGYISLTDLSVLQGTASLSFWINTTASGNNTGWQAPAVAGVEQTGGVNDIFWGWLDANGRIGLTKGNDFAATKSTVAINNGQYRHIVLTRNASSGAFQIFIDGVLDNGGTLASQQGVVTTPFNDLGRVLRTDDAGINYLTAALDEVQVYDRVLNASQVQQLFQQQSEQRDTDGSVRLCPAEPLQCLADDFGGVLSAENWVTSSSSGDFTPSVVGERLRITQAIANQSTSATYQRLYPAADNLVVVEFDYWAYGGNGADGLALVLSDASVTPQAGAFGGPLGYGFKPGISGFAGGWLGFGIDEYGNYSNEGGDSNIGRRRQAVVVRGSGEGTSGYNYLRGTCDNGNDRANTGCLSPAVDGNQNNPHRYRFIIDSRQSGSTLVSVDRDTGSGFEPLILPFDAQNAAGQAPVPENFFLSITGSTGGSTNIHELDNLSICALRSQSVGVLIDHFQISHPAQTVSCLAAPVEVKACLTSSCSDASEIYTDPVTVTLTASAEATWAGGATLTLNNGVGTAYLRNPDLASGAAIEFEAVSSIPAAKAFFRERNRCIADGVAGADGETCNIQFVDSGLIFTQTDLESPLAHQVAGDNFAGVLRAIRTNTLSGACEARVVADQPVQLGFSCENPTSCITRQQFKVNGTAIDANNTGEQSNRSMVDLIFDDSGNAPLTMQYSDVGQLRLHASLTLPEESPEPAVTLQGSSNAFVVKPHTLALAQAVRPDGSSNPATTSTGAGFVAAGEPFSIVIEARNANGDATPNFGREISRQRVEPIFNRLEYPTAGSNGVLTAGTTDLTQPAANGRQTVSNVSWNEAGSITLQARLTNNDYLGAGDVLAKPASNIIGRFYPNHFMLESSEVKDACIVSPNPDLHFSYMGEDRVTVNYQVLAKGVNDNILENYDSAVYAKTAKMLVVAEHNFIRLDAGRLAINSAQWQRGVYRAGQTDASFNRIAIPDGPYKDLQLGLTVLPETEQDNRNFQNFSLGTDAVVLSGTLDIRYGRLQMANSFGPEFDDLPVNLTAEYWDESRFQPNSADNCSVISATDLSLTNSLTTAEANAAALKDGKTPVSGLLLLAPGEPGTVTATYQVPAWLQYNWSGKTSSCSANPAEPATPNCYDEHPSAEFIFGRYRGNPRQIYWREIF